MKTEPAELLKDALALPPEARSALVESLLESLDAGVGDDAHEAWREEIERRLRQIDSGAVSMMPWGDARRSLLSVNLPGFAASRKRRR
jgi:putative addiction module component (TIGR02574 family)